jgi:hypothetical protein
MLKNVEKKGLTALANFQMRQYIMHNGCGSPEATAAVAPVMGGDSHTFFDDFYFESVGRCICTGVTVATSSTPAGSFFVPDVEVGEKSHKQSYRRLKCSNAPTRSAKDTLPTRLLSALNRRRLRPGSNNSISSTL